MDYPIPSPEKQYKGPDHLRQQHNKRNAGVLPRDGEPKKSSLVGWEDSSTVTTFRDQAGKNSMTPEPCLEEKTMRKSGGESQVLKKQAAGFSNNVGGSAKAKTGVDNYNGVLVGGDINQYADMLSSKQKEDGRKTQHDPDASNTILNEGGTISAHDQKEKIKGENTASPTIPSSDEKEEKGHENATFDINVPKTTPSNEKEKKELLSNVEHKDNGGTQTSDPSKRNATEEVQTSSYRPGESSTTSPNNNPSKIAPHHDQEKEHEDDGTKSHPDPSRTIANGYEGTKDVGLPYLTSQPEGGCSPCCSSCSVL